MSDITIGLIICFVLLLAPIAGMLWPAPKRAPSRIEAITSELVDDWIVRPISYVLVAAFFCAAIYWWVSSVPVAVIVVVAVAGVAYWYGRTSQS
jgi:hypothetical protein